MHSYRKLDPYRLSWHYTMAELEEKSEWALHLQQLALEKIDQVNESLLADPK